MTQQILSVLFLATPAGFAAYVAFAKPQPILGWVGAFDLWIRTTQPTYRGKAGYIKKIFCQPVLWAFKKIELWTQNIQDNFVRCGVRAASYLYIGAILFGAIAYLTFLVVMSLFIIIAVIIGLFFALALLGALLGGGKHQGRI